MNKLAIYSYLPNYKVTSTEMYSTAESVMAAMFISFVIIIIIIATHLVWSVNSVSNTIINYGS